MPKSSVMLSMPQVVDLALNTPESGTVNFNILHALLQVLIQQVDLADTKIEFVGDEGERVQSMMSSSPGPSINLTEYILKADESQKKVVARKSRYKNAEGNKDEIVVDKEHKIGKPGAEGAKLTDPMETVVVVEPISGKDAAGAHVSVALSKVHFGQLENDIKKLKEDVKELKELPGNADLIAAVRSNASPVLDMFQMLTLSKRVEAAEEGTAKLASLVEDLVKEQLPPEFVKTFEKQEQTTPEKGQPSVQEQSSVKTEEQASVKAEQASVKTEHASVKPEEASVKTEQASVKTEQASVKTEDQNIEKIDRKSSSSDRPRMSILQAFATDLNEKIGNLEQRVTNLENSQVELAETAAQAAAEAAAAAAAVGTGSIVTATDTAGEVTSEAVSKKSSQQTVASSATAPPSKKQPAKGKAPAAASQTPSEAPSDAPSPKSSQPVGPTSADIIAGQDALEARVTELEEKFKQYNDYIAVIDNTFNEQVATLQQNLVDLEKEIGEIIERINAGLPAGDSGATEEGGRELYNKVMSLQDELDQLAETATKLLDEKDDRQGNMDALLEQIELLKTIKANREDLQDALANKADSCTVNRKVSHDQFDAACDELSHSIEDAVRKLTQQEQMWQQALLDIQNEIENKLDKMELTPLRDFVHNKLKMLQERLKALAAMRQDTEAAGTKSKFLRNVNCISCDKDVVMRKEIDASFHPPAPTLPGTKSIGPYLAYELDQLRKQQKCAPHGRNMNHFQNAMNAYKLEKNDHMCNRYCGGSHTTTTPQQRVARLGHFLQQWGPESVISDAEARGADGQSTSKMKPSMIVSGDIFSERLPGKASKTEPADTKPSATSSKNK